MKNRLQKLIVVLSAFFLCTLTISAEWRWIETAFPENVTSFAGTSAGQHIFVTSYNESECTGQIYTSHDFGETWSVSVDYTERTNLTSIVTTSDNRSFAMSYNCQTMDYELIMSHDLGQTWDPAPSNPVVGESSEYRYVKIYNGMDDRLYFCAPLAHYPDVYLASSDDFAQSWEPCGAMPDGYQISAMKVITFDHLMAGDVAGNIFESFDAGVTWTSGQQIYPRAVVSLECIPQERCLAGVSLIPFQFIREWNTNEWIESTTEFETKGFCVSSESTLYVATGGVRQSMDHGLTWMEMVIDSEDAIVDRIFQADDGYLYGMGGQAVIRSEEPVIPPTFTPTAGPGTPTYTPHPPSFTPTPWPTHTPTFTPTPQRPTQPPQPTPGCPGISVVLDYPADTYAAGSPFYLTARICNPLNFQLSELPLIVLLQIDAFFWFAPTWTDDLDYFTENWQPGWTTYPVIPEFPWPENAGSCSEAVFWAALMNPDFTDLVGDYARWSFAWL